MQKREFQYLESKTIPKNTSNDPIRQVDAQKPYSEVQSWNLKLQWAIESDLRELLIVKIASRLYRKDKGWNKIKDGLLSVHYRLK